jgi:hypothetical protein
MWEVGKGEVVPSPSLSCGMGVSVVRLVCGGVIGDGRTYEEGECLLELGHLLFGQ